MLKNKSTSSFETTPLKAWETFEMVQERAEQEAAMQEAYSRAAREYDRRTRFSIAERIGLTALKGVADLTSASIIAAHNTSSKIQERREKARIRKGKPVSPLELRKKTGKLKGKGLPSRAARAYQEIRDERRFKREREIDSAGYRAVAKYREENPAIEAREQREREAIARHDNVVQVGENNRWVVGYFRDRNIYSFAKAIPRRPRREGEEGYTGGYTELAKDTLSAALLHRDKDGNVPLVNRDIQRERLASRERKGQTVWEAGKAEREYAMGGVSTTLWQLGFIEGDEDRLTKYGKGKFNEDIQWGKTEDQQGLTARIPFNPENELHQTLAADHMMMSPDGGEMTNPMIEVEMPNGHISKKGSWYMDLRMVNAPTPDANSTPTVESKPPMAMAA